MGIRINTNVASLTAQNKLSQTSKKLNTSLERLSTGLRINRGSDDVVGLLKSESLRSQIRGITTAQQNISNGSNLLGVAEGSLAQLTEIAQNLREKVVQAADSTLSAADRSNITTAVSDLLNEYSRLTAASEFAGVKLLDGTFTSKTFQVGPNSPDTITLSLTDARSAAVGQVAILTTSSVTTTLGSSTATFTDAGTLTIAGTGISGLTTDSVSDIEATESALAYANAINSFSGTTGVTAQVLANTYVTTYGAGTGLTTTQNLYVNGVAVANAAYADTDAGGVSLVNAINNISSQTGVSATLDTVNNTITYSANDGRNISLRVSAQDSTAALYNGITTIVSVTSSTTLVRGKIKVFSDSAFAFVDSSSVLGTSATVGVSTSTSLNLINVGSSANASSALFTLDNVIRQLQNRRSTVGSKAVRFETALTELQSRQENYSQAESVIRDTDVAKETANLTSYQILQQAGVSVLSRANSLPQIALSLLQQ